ncbi:MAG: OsmC family protein [Chitinophagaceae bacterium]
MKTTTFWKSGHAFDSYQKESKIEIDSNGGFGPKALLLTGLAGCSGIDVVDVLEKMRVPFASLKIEAEAEQTEEHPKVFKDIHLTFYVKTEEENHDKIKKAIDLSLTKYCGVAAMLQKNSKIDYTIVLQKEGEE